MAQALLRSKSMLKDAERQSNPWVEQLRSPSPEPGRAFGPISQQRAPLEKYTSNHGRHLVEDSSLLDAVWRGNVGAVRRLLKGGADPNAEDILAGRVTTPLCEAVRHAHTNVVRVLLDAGAQPDLVTSTGVSPVSCAESDACFDAVTMVCAASQDARLRRIAEESRCSPTRRVPKHKHLLIVRPSLAAVLSSQGSLFLQLSDFQKRLFTGILCGGTSNVGMLIAVVAARTQRKR